MKLDYKKTFIIGLGFFTVSIVWNIYNVAVPIYLKNLQLSGFATGAVMAMDNVFAVLFQPIFGALSDKTNTRYGRRMPYLLIGIPLSAIFFFIVPFTSTRLVYLMITLILLNFFMSVYRAPTVALMPDFTPRPLRSKANGIINFMGGVGAAISFLLGGLLFNMKEYYPFFAGSMIMIITIILMYFLIREPQEVKDDLSDKNKNIDREYEKGQTLSLVFLLLAIFFWFTGFNAVETFFSTYGDVVLNVGKSMSSYLLSTVSILFIIFAIPAGLISRKIGRKNTILIGLVILMATFVSLIFIKDIPVMFVILGIGGIGWALININSYPMVVEMTSNRGIGKYTGYYYFFSMLAAIVSPIFYGFLKDNLGDGFLFIYASISLIFAFFFMMLVKHGEAPQVSESVFENLEHMEQ